MGLFTGLATAEVSSKANDPIPGVGDFLVNSIRKKDNRKGGYRVVCDLTCLRSVKDGNSKGDRVQYTIFGNDYFHKDMKKLLLVLMDVPASEEATVVETVVQMNPAVAKLDEPFRSAKAWEYLGQEAAALKENDTPKESGGMFDGQVVLRMETVVQPPKQRKNKQGNLMFTQNSSGVTVPDMTDEYINSYPQRIVPISEVCADFDEKDIERFFGSAEALEALLGKE